MRCEWSSLEMLGRRGGATPKDEPYLGRQISWGCRFGKSPGNRKTAKLACGEEEAQLIPGGKTKGSKERRKGLKPNLQSQPTLGYLARGKG